MTSSLIILLDIKDPHSYLALDPLLQLAAETGAASRWYPFLNRPLAVPREPVAGDARGVWHRWHRAYYQERDLCRYAEARELAARHFRDGGLYRQASGEVAAMGFNWAAGGGREPAFEYLRAAFTGYWDGALDVDAVDQIAALLESRGLEADGFDAYCQGHGLEELAAQRQDLVEQGAFAAPAVMLHGEVYLGRQHLPLIRHLLRAEGAGEA